MEGVAFRGSRVWMEKHQHEFAAPARKRKKP